MSETDEPQDLAEALDEDKLDLPPGEEEDRVRVDFPPDRPLGVDDPELREGLVDEPLGRRLAREEPDPLVVELDQAAEVEQALVGDRGSGADRLLDELEVEVPDPELDEELSLVLAEDDDLDELDRTAGQIVDPTPDVDHEPQAVADEVPDPDEETAEEAAMHIEGA